MREHKGYLCLHKENGDSFISLEDFCSTPKPYGLGYNVDVINRIIRERLEWQRQRKLEQVPEARPGSRTDLTSSHDDARLDSNRTTKQRARAINRAPEIIRKLYKSDCLGESEASRMGSLKPSEEKQKQISHITTELESLPMPTTPKEKRDFKRKANTIVKKTLNILDFKIMDDPDKAAKALIKRFQGDRLRRLY